MRRVISPNTELRGVFNLYDAPFAESASFLNEEDARADVDFNVVMTDRHDFVEVQGTAEDGSFPRETLDEILDLAATGIGELLQIQDRVLGLGTQG